MLPQPRREALVEPLSRPCTPGSMRTSLTRGLRRRTTQMTRRTRRPSRLCASFDFPDRAVHISSDKKVISSCQLETGYVSSHLLSAGEETQIFSLGSVQFTLPSALLHLRVAANTLFMALHPLTVILIDLSRPSDLTTIDLPAPKLTKGASAGQAGSSAASVITGIWPDQTGKHLIVGTSSGEAWYLTCSLEGGPSSSSTVSQTVEWRRPKTALKALKPSPTNAWTSVAWSPPPPSTSSKPSGREVLFATASGQIHYVVLLPQEDLFKSQERDFGTMYTFAERTPVTGLAWGGGGESGRKAWVLACQEGGKGWVWEGMVNSSGPKWVEELLVKGKGPSASSSCLPALYQRLDRLIILFALPQSQLNCRLALRWTFPRRHHQRLLSTRRTPSRSKP